MIWQNPWAWVGLLSIGIPVLIHLLGRGHARVRHFPTLRFLDASRLLPTRRTRVHDFLLLAIRAGILAAAVAALAQPLLFTAGRRQTLATTLTRAIVVDTSASMRRAIAPGGTALDAGLREARSLADSAPSSVVIETAAPRRAIAGAAAWLSRQAGRRELVVLSDFQNDALNAADLAPVPSGVGIRLRRTGVLPADTTIEAHARSGHGETIARAILANDHTESEWSVGAAAHGAGTGDGVLFFAAPAERAGLDAALRAAGTIGVALPMDTSRVVAIVYSGYEGRAELLRRGTALRAPWMTDFVARLRADSMLAVARAGDGTPLVVTLEDTTSGANRLLLFSAADAGSLSSATLIAAVRRATSTAPDMSELDPTTISDDVLASWQRAPASNGSSDTDTSAAPFDGRWLWVLALLLLLVETRLRRATPPVAADGAPLTVDRRVA